MVEWNMKLYVFGDVGGHYYPLAKSLARLGVDIDKGTIPEDVHIMQVGDLIHKGPHSDAVVFLVDELRKTGQWHQLFGNHEMQHLGGQRFFRCSCAHDNIIPVLEKWVEAGDGVLARGVVLDKPHPYFKNKEVLITHAGLTHHQYLSLNQPNLNSLVQKINSDVSASVVNRSGVMLQTGFNRLPRPDMYAGIVWAHSTEELYPSWEHQTPVFDQVHGHTSPFAFSRHEWWRHVAREWRQRIKVYQEGTRMTVCTVDEDKSFVGVDPDYDKHAGTEFQPYLELDIKEIF